jgi:hypothetical protein
MGKSFKDNYYDDDDFGKKRQGSNHKVNRQKIKNFLNRIDGDEDIFDEDFDIEKEVL